MEYSRRTIIAMAAQAAILRAASVNTRAAQGGELTVLDWAGFDDSLYWIDFKNTHPEANVTFEIGASDADILAKMSAGDQADVFHPYTGWLQFYVDQGLVEELDTSRLPNWSKIADRFKALGQFDGKQYFVPYDWGFSSILYRTDLAPDAGESWDALFNTDYAGHISMWDDGVAAVDVASYVQGWNELELTPEQLDQIKEQWIEQRAHNLFYWSGEPELVEAMASGDVWVAYAWQGAYATLRGQDVPVAYANPKEGRNSWVGYYGIRKGSENLDLAYDFLNGKMADQTARNVIENFYYGSANQDVMNAITDPELIEVLAIKDPSVLDRTHFTPNITTEQRDAWAELWVDVKAS